MQFEPTTTSRLRLTSLIVRIYRSHQKHQKVTVLKRSEFASLLDQVAFRSNLHPIEPHRV